MALLDELRGAVMRSRRVGERADAEHELVGEELDLGRPDVGGEEVREPELRERQALGEADALLVLAPGEVGAEPSPQR